MGNQHSSHSSSSQPQSPVGSSSHHGSHGHSHLGHPGFRTGRRESIQSTIKAAQIAPPSASLESAERGRASTQANATTHASAQLRAAQDRSIVSIARDGSSDKMGNEQSHQKKDRDREDRLDKLSRQSTPQPPRPASITPPQAVHPPPAAPSTTTTTTTTNTTTTPPPAGPTFTPLPAGVTSTPPPGATSTPPSGATPTPPPTEAHAIPIHAPHSYRAEQALAGSLEPADASQDFIVPSSHFSRPPRLPLPIEEEVHTPGSPIISPNDLASPLDPGEVEGALPRRTSMLSSTTADDDDLGEEFKVPTPGRPTVPTLIEWEGPGDRVYVTGTFAGWNRKYRLHKNGPSKKENALSAHVPIHPGTHHLMFIVDNDMMISDKLPTAVDYTNILVNYLEVSYDDINDQQAQAAADKATDTPARTEEQSASQPPQNPPSPEVPTVKPATAEIPNTKLPEPEKRYHSKIPAYLLDLDAPEESSRFARANAAAGNLPTPPSLPMFLSKSILNGTTPMKDDSSVLIMPNHTVLNHLATSSIKDNVLATSATTRYKQKFLTTIMYKPKEESGEVY